MLHSMCLTLSSPADVSVHIDDKISLAPNTTAMDPAPSVLDRCKHFKQPAGCVQKGIGHCLIGEWQAWDGGVGDMR